MLYRYRLALCSLLLTGYVSAQITISGRIIDDITGAPLEGLLVSSSVETNAKTDAQGKFTLAHAETATIRLMLTYGELTTPFEKQIDPVASTDLGDIPFSAARTLGSQELPTITLDDDEQEDAESISGLLHSGGDLFSQITRFTFSPSGFDRRGLVSMFSAAYLNYFPVNDLESGNIYFSNWGGLNDVMRVDEELVGAEFADWSFGATGSTYHADLRASVQRAQTQIRYAVTNRNYRNRIMATWSTGLRPSGWALSLSASKRWAEEGYIPGTFYDGYSYFASLEKRMGDNHALNLVVLGSPYKRGGSSTSIREMYDLAGDNYYNSFWGYQQGEKRNARVYSGHQPIAMLRHDWKITDKLSLITNLGWQNGKSKSQALDWFNAPDPRPDYYRRLPSYVDNPAVAQQIRNTLTGNPALLQIQWDNLYQVNFASAYTVQNVNGVPGQTYSGNFSQYILEDRISDTDKKSGNIVLQYLAGETGKLLAGVNVMQQTTRNYKEVADLLGGDYYVDWDKYAEQDFPGNDDLLQNDLLRPNRIVLEGDQFGYDYESRVSEAGAWLSYKVDLSKWEIGVAGAYKRHAYSRYGYTQNGKFPDNSFGESEKHSFNLPSGKALVRYKIDGRNYLTVSGMYEKDAPTFRNAYLSPRTRDAVADGLTARTTKLGEVRYDLNSPYLNVSVAGYYILTEDGINTASFYHDDERTFVNVSMTGIDRRHRGIEAAIGYDLSPSIALEGAAAISEYILTSRPIATITQDNDGSVLQENVTIYSENYYFGGTPQEAYTVGLTYKSKRYWSIFLNVNHFRENWIGINPLRRTQAAVDLVEPGSQQWNEILIQEKTEPATTVDLSFSKSLLAKWLNDDARMALNISITNLLNNEDYISNGFEQYRYDFEHKDPATFPSKYSYMQGLNFFVQGTLSF